jgi:molybdopterin/thiamine biosynthesis adenylyltransferase
MTQITQRYDRNILLFGAQGQARLSATRVAVVGVGGLGSPLVQHLALLGVAAIALVEPEELDDTNRNRFIGARADDPVPGSLKVTLAHRLIAETNPDVAVTPIPHGLVSPEAFAAVKAADWVFGCFDHDGPRYVLNELCAAYAKPYIDLASDVPEPGVYGGRVCVSQQGTGCLACLDLLDLTAVNRWLASPADRHAQDAIYGINREALAEKKGPSVSPINGVVASLGATEFMVAVTGMRPPRRLLNYYGHIGKVTDASGTARAPYCAFCHGIHGQPAAADVDRYLRMPHLR